MWHIDPVSLRLFIAVCEEGAISKASEREFIAPSAVSKRIADIEADIGTPMLLRSKKGVVPTPAGQALLRHARQLLRSMERLQGELSEYAEGARGHVKILANVSSIIEFLPEELSEFMLENAHIHVDIEERFSPDVVRGVAEGQADLGVCRKSMVSGDLEFIDYRSDHLAVVVNGDHPLAGRTQLAFAETLDYDHLDVIELAGRSGVVAHVWLLGFLLLVPGYWLRLGPATMAKAINLDERFGQISRARRVVRARPSAANRPIGRVALGNHRGEASPLLIARYDAGGFRLEDDYVIRIGNADVRPGTAVFVDFGDGPAAGEGFVSIDRPLETERHAGGQPPDLPADLGQQAGRQ